MVLVEPPMAISRVMAFLNAALVTDGTRQQVRLITLVVALGQLDDAVAGGLEQPPAIGVGGQHRAVAGQRQAQGLGQAVHRVGSEHA